MNHGPLFWKTYNILKKDMAELDAKGYTGEGFYSRGRSLTSTLPISQTVPESDVPENLCGGSWQRKKQTRRRKTGGRKRKFKGEGLKIGEDESKRRELEGGKAAAKSRVAKSKRARELRAEAAARRHAGQPPKTEPEESESESDEDVEEVVKYRTLFLVWG
jgi:DNA-dependent metalloprotease WSS1